MEMLINVDDDPFEMHDLSQSQPRIVRHMRDKLPVGAYRKRAGLLARTELLSTDDMQLNRQFEIVRSVPRIFPRVH
eukprot:6406665-Amphidinium_carterae.1